MAANLLQKFRDKKILGRLRKKDSEAFIQLYDEYAGDLYRFIYFKVGKAEEAQDLTSMVFLKAWNHLQTNSLSDSKTLRALIYKIARNAIIDHYREGRDKISSLDDEDRPIEIIDEDQDLTAQIDTNLQLEKLSGWLLELKEEYREVIVLKFVNDLELEEIAAVTGKSRGNIRVILHRALEALKSIAKADEQKTDTK